jgi:hypothetical protein
LFCGFGIAFFTEQFPFEMAVGLGADTVRVKTYGQRAQARDAVLPLNLKTREIS